MSEEPGQIEHIHILKDDKFMMPFLKRQQRFSKVKYKYLMVVKNSDVDYQPQFLKDVDFEIMNTDEFTEYIQSSQAASVSKLFIHFLYNRYLPWLKLVPSSISVYWMFWGADAFQDPEFYGDFTDTYSHQFEKKPKEIEKFRWYKNPINTYRWFIYQSEQEKEFKNRYGRIDYFCHYLKEDYDLIKEKLNLRADFVPFQYGSMSDLVPEHSNYASKSKDDLSSSTGFKIMIGNSASIFNNHVSMLNDLKIYEDKIQKIYCPLSYSGEEKYIDLVVSKGQELFGDKFDAMLEFMPLNAYNELVGNIDFFIYNHYRSQAYGNICGNLFMMKNVGMNDRSNLYKYLGTNGIEIEKIDSLFEIKNESRETAANNKKNILQITNDEFVDNMVKKIVS